jgi:DNA invertase Pin-like site-specific DNA recombinase
MSPMIAAVYARKSTDQNLPDAEQSVTRQVEQATAYATRKGWTVDPAHVYQDDGISGAEFVKRPGLTRLMNAVRPHAPFQVLVMSEESRLGREQIETAYLLKQLITAGVRVAYYLEDRERTLGTPTDKILLAVSGFADEVERDKARQRTYDAMHRKAGAGHVTGGVVFGYENVPVLTADGKRDHLTRRILEPEAVVVRRIFALSAEGLGTRRIAHTLNAEGAPAPRPRRGGRPQAWDPATIYAMLTRPLYRGEIVWNQTKKRDAWGVQAQRPRPEADWVRVPAPELRIVPEPLWLVVERRLASMRKFYLRTTNGTLHGRARGASGTESKYLLTGLAECGICHGGLTVHSRATGGRRTSRISAAATIARARPSAATAACSG